MLLLLIICGGQAGASAKPNIILLLADDLGYGDVSCQNPFSKISTPNIDRLAAQGMRFTDAHAPSALCTPTRYALMTGQYCWRTRLKAGVLNMWDEPLIAPERLTVAGLLHGQGYRTACFGKWHLGLAWPFVRAVPRGFDLGVAANDIDWQRPIGGGPVVHGFDYYFGVNVPNEPPYAFIENDHVLGVINTQYSSVSGQESHWAGPGVAGWDWRQTLPTVSSNAIRWLQRSLVTNTPFFLYCPFTGPHQPVVPTAEFQGTSEAGGYGDFVQEIDAAVGQILDAVEAAGAATNTLVIFTSDNGPDEYAYDRLQQYGHASMGPLRGIKSDIWEGGHRIPFVASWPKTIAAGSTCAQTICLNDFMRTAADLVGASVPADAAEDSVSFVPALLGQSSTNTARSLILESGCGQFGLRSNNWIYIDSYTGDGHDPELEPLWFEQSRGYPLTSTWPALLYDLQADPAEGTNLYVQQPLTVSQLLAELHRCRAATTWLGTHCDRWTDASNWAPAGCRAGADVLFTNAPGAVNFTQILGTNVDLNSLTLQSGLTNNINIQAGGPFVMTLQNGIDMGAADTDLKVNSDVVLRQSQVWNVRSNQMLTIDGGVALDCAQLMTCGGGNININGTVSGRGGLVLRGSGFLSLGGTNTFWGGAEICGGGLLAARSDTALGYGRLTIPNHSTLWLMPGVTLTNSASIMGFGGSFARSQQGAFTVYNSGNANFNGPVTLTGDTGVRANRLDSVLTFGGPISGGGNFTVMAGSGKVVFAAANVYTGDTVLNGTLMITKGPDRLPTGTSLIFINRSAATLDLDNYNQTIGALSGGGQAGGNITLGSGTLTIAQHNSTTFSGSISGTGNVIKSGSGSLTLAGASSYSGTTTVAGGTLAVNGSLGNTPVTVGGGGTLAGTGSLAGPVLVQNGGTLAPGPGIGSMTLGNELTLSGGGIVQVKVDPLGNINDCIIVQNQVSYGGYLEVSVLGGASTLTNGRSFKIFSATSSSGVFQRVGPAPGAGQAWSFHPASGILTVVARPTLQWVRAGNHALQLTWSGNNFQLQAQTNPLSVGMTDKWFDYPGGNLSPIDVPVVSSNKAVFLRLVSP